MTYINKTTNVLVKFPIKNQCLITTIITNIYTKNKLGKLALHCNEYKFQNSKTTSSPMVY